MDLDADGRSDLISGSWPGELYWFRRKVDGSFADAEQLKDRDGAVLRLGHATAAFAADWDADGDLDLVVGNLLGEIHVVVNDGTPEHPAFGKPERICAAGQPIKVREGDAAPIVADWDGDGRNDLLVGTEAGSVLWYRNVGTTKRPEFDQSRVILRDSPVGWGDDSKRNPGDWGLRVKICAVDWNGDGRLDLLLGDRCGGFSAKPVQSEAEKSHEQAVFSRLPELRKEWAEVFQQYRKRQGDPGGADEAARRRNDDELQAFRDRLGRLKEEIAAAQKIASYYQPQTQSHGFVWLFLRKPAEG